MAKKQFSVRLRRDQEKQMQLLLKLDPELDQSTIGKAIDEYLSARVRGGAAEPRSVATKKKSSAQK